MSGLSFPDAPCHGATHLFYADDRGRGGDNASRARAAKKVCRTCPHTLACLDYAIANNETFGIWGGLSEKQRRNVRIRRRICGQDAA